MAMTTDGTYDYYVVDYAGIQNGAPDGLALSNNGEVIEFLSYEGTFEATNGTASGMTSTDIGVAESGATAVGESLQRDLAGTFQEATAETRGAANAFGGTIEARINEFHYDNDGTDVGEFVEIRTNAGDDVSGLLVELYNGGNGEQYNSASVSTLTMSTDGTYDYYLWELPTNGIQNGSPDGIALSNNGEVIEFISYEGEMTATNGTASGMTSTDVGVSETGSTAAGQSLQRDSEGNWQDPLDETRGTENNEDTGGGDPTPLLISEIQGEGSATLLSGEFVLVSALVTYTTSDGFYLQEEESDYDANDLTSEGIFVFTGGAPAVSVGDQVEVTGTAGEFSGQTQISNVTDIVTLGTGFALQDQIDLVLPFANATDLERYEGMRITLSTSDPEAPLTVIENFNFDRFGEITVSAGTQTQPTQLFDAQTEAAEVAELAEANANNRLLIDDANSSQNPDSFEFVPVTAENGDNGNGYLDSGDDFSQGATLRLGTEITEPIEGVLGEGFGEYRMVVDDQIVIDESTNSGARQDTPDDVGGSIQVASFNVLNYFTTLDDGSQTGPNGDLDPRGADTAEELVRQTDKIVEAIIATEADVLALQELENNGFGGDSAISTLVDALNARATDLGTGAVYTFVDPTGGVGDGFIGTDAITTGIIYDTTKVNLVYSDTLVFEESSAADTFAIAEVLNPYASSDDQVGDFQRSRPATAATFEEIASGETFTVVSNHFKSKGDSNLEDLALDVQSALDAGSVPADQIATVEAALADLIADPNYDQGNGQAFWNQARTDAANELVAWLEGDYAAALNNLEINDADYLVMGDFNAYAEEDPVQAVRDGAGYEDLIDTYIGQDAAYSFVFDGQQGTLDQALASASMADQVTGLTEWHINADEPDLLNYDNSFNNGDFYNPDVFASSDHDPVIVGLDLGADDLAA